MRVSNLWPKFETSYRVWIWNEGNTGSTFDHTANVFVAGHIGQMPENAEYCDAGQHWCWCVQYGHNICIAIYIMIEFVEWRVHDDIAKAHGQWEKALRDGRIPNLYNRQ